MVLNECFVVVYGVAEKASPFRHLPWRARADYARLLHEEAEASGELHARVARGG